MVRIDVKVNTVEIFLSESIFHEHLPPLPLATKIKFTREKKLLAQ